MKQKKYVYFFNNKKNTDGSASMFNTLGGKGANLAEMCNLGIPVPPGITISSDVCGHFLKHNSLPKNLESTLIEYIKKLETEIGSIFGDANNPLLFSVRSGARQSMPGMMETILNIGLSLKTIPGLINKTGNSRFVYDSYRRLIMMYADVVLEKPENLDNKGIRLKLDSILSEQKKRYGKFKDSDLSTAELIEICNLYKEEIDSSLDKKFPDDPFEQLWGAIRAVFLSWNGERAKKYREIESIPDYWGTAVNIQCMVFGNMGESSATGVAFTRNPANGDINLYGEWLPNAQGEDVVSGIRTPFPINNFSKNNLTINSPTLEESFPKTYKNEF